MSVFAPAALDQIYLVTMRGELCQQTILSTFCYRISQLTGVAPQIGQVAQAIESQLSLAGDLYGKYRLCAPDNYVFRESTIQVIAPIRYMAERWPRAENGLVGFDALSANVAAVITRRGQFGNRRGVSTLHVPLATDNTLYNDGVIQGVMLSDLADLADQMDQNLNLLSGSVNLNPVIYNPTGSPYWTDLVQFTAEDTTRVMRRRTVGLGI